jgi:hypothetical protein
MPPGDGHGDRQDSEADALEAAADQQLGKVLRYRRNHAADDNTAEREKNYVSLPGAVGQPAHDRSDERTG